MPFMRYCGKIL